MASFFNFQAYGTETTVEDSGLTRPALPFECLGHCALASQPPWETSLQLTAAFRRKEKTTAAGHPPGVPWHTGGRRPVQAPSQHHVRSLFSVTPGAVRCAADPAAAVAAKCW